MAFIVLMLLHVGTVRSQSSSTFIRTSVTESGKVHFIKPIEMKKTKSAGLTLDITATQTGNKVDSAVINFTFSTKGAQPRIDSAQLDCDGEIIHIQSVKNYFVERKGKSWLSRNGMRISGDELKALLGASEPTFKIYPKEQALAESFSASGDWKKMAVIAVVILFP